MTDEDARRDVLTRFMEACDPAPTGPQLAEWRLRHPEFAVDLGEFADAMARSPGTSWVDDGRGEEAAARALALVEVLEGTLGLLPSRGRGGSRARGGRRGAR